MSADINNINLTCRVGSDPEMRYLDDGKAVANLRVAVNDFKDNTDWIKLTCWGSTAEFVANYVHKGDRLAVTGRLMPPSAWLGKQDNAAHASNEVTAERVVLVSSKGAGQGEVDDDRPF